MRVWQEDQINALLDHDSEESLFAAIAALAREMGFDLCAYGARMPLPVSQPKIVMLNNYPEDWRIRYAEENYLAVDPTIQHGQRSLLPVVWSDDLFSPARDFWEDARSFGLRFGWAQSSRDPSGVAGLLTLARSGEALTATELEAKGYRMSWLCQVAHTGMAQRLMAKMNSEREVSLSNREVAVLRWTAEGKTSADIAEILNISERTVNWHITNATLKLGAANKTAAAVQAAVLGLLY